MPELRLKIRDGKYRVPDVMVLPAEASRTPVIETAPLLCIEVLSPDDRLREVTQRAADYLSIGVPQTWIFDPETKSAYIYSSVGLQEWKPSETNRTMQCGPIELDTARLFAG